MWTFRSQPCECSEQFYHPTQPQTNVEKSVGRFPEEWQNKQTCQKKGIGRDKSLTCSECSKKWRKTNGPKNKTEMKEEPGMTAKKKAKENLKRNTEIHVNLGYRCIWNQIFTEQKNHIKLQKLTKIETV